MNNTPQRVTVTLAAGETKRVAIPGNWLQVVSCTVAAFQYAFDNDPLTDGESYFSYPSKTGFDAVRFRDSLGAGCIIVADIADTLPSDNRGNRDQLLALLAKLTTIDVDTGAMVLDLDAVLEELQGDTAAATIVADVTPVAVTAIIVLAANANRHGCCVQAMSTNGASIFIGSTNLVTNVNKILELQPGQGFTWDDYRGPLWAYSVAGGDVVHGGEW